MTFLFQEKRVPYLVASTYDDVFHYINIFQKG